jgi:hypothetical protein
MQNGELGENELPYMRLRELQGRAYKCESNGEKREKQIKIIYINAFYTYLQSSGNDRALENINKQQN